MSQLHINPTDTNNTENQSLFNMAQQINDLKKNLNYYIKPESELHELRNSLLQSFKNAKIASTDIPKNYETNDKPDLPEPYDEKEEKEKEHNKNEGDMFDDVAEMKKLINIKGTGLEKELIAMEKRLHYVTNISRKCHHSNCNKVAPDSYPRNIYLCDKHKEPLRRKLEEYKIPIHKGSPQEREKCKKLRDLNQNIINSLKIPDAQQSFGQNQHKYPKDYFSVTMSKLILCQQELSKPLSSTDDTKQSRDSRRKMRRIVEQLMDLLIVARQNLNCHWCCVCAMILSVCATVGGGIKWIVINPAYIAALYPFLGFFIGVIIAGFIFGDRDMKFVAGAAAVGTGLGVMAGAVAGTEYGAVVGAVFGPPGVVAGGICGGLIFGGLAALYKYG